MTEKRQCVAHKKNGERCKLPPLDGAVICGKHGANKTVRAKAAVVAELRHWRLGDTTEDPGEVLLKLVTQSSRRCAFYGQLLEEAYEAAEQLAATGQSDLHGLILPETEIRGHQADQARERLDRVFQLGGVSTLVGATYGAVKDMGVYETGEAIRGLADLEAKERERCANFATKAIAAGLAERTVRIAERQGALMVEMVQAALNEIDLPQDYRGPLVAALAKQARELTA